MLPLTASARPVATASAIVARRGDGPQGAIAGKAGTDAKDVWVANDDGSAIVRERDIATATLLDSTPREGQQPLFSATLDGAVDILAGRFLSQPARHAVDAVSARPEIAHHLLTVMPADRVKVLATMASGEFRVLIFTRTKLRASKLARNLAAFASGEVHALLAADITARGIQLDGIGH